MHLYFAGIGGSGLSGLAHLALDLGYTVSGSDPGSNSSTKELTERGTTIGTLQDGSWLGEINQKDPIDWFVYTSALKADHPELLQARKNGIKVSKRDEFINHLIQTYGLKLVAVAGTHGKTTTTAMIVWLFKQLQIPVSYLVGSGLSWARSAQYQPGSEYFILECDEFDRNFLHYHPFVSVLTSIDYDHPDTYKSQKDYVEAFKQFFNQSKHLIAFDEDLQKTGYDQNTTKIGAFSNLNKTECRKKHFPLITLPGDHNKYNSALAQICFVYCWEKQYNSIPKTEITGRDFSKTPLSIFDQSYGNNFLNKGENFNIDYKIINTFPLPNRRFEKLADNIYSDYAHHPTEIAATLQLADEVRKNMIKNNSVEIKNSHTRENNFRDDYSSGINPEVNSKSNTPYTEDKNVDTNKTQIVVVYQPHQNIRQHDTNIQKGYESCFHTADKIYWLPTFLSRENDLPVLSQEYLVQFIPNKQKIILADLSQTLQKEIHNELKSGNLVILMGAGSIDAWFRERFAELQ